MHRTADAAALLNLATGEAVEVLARRSGTERAELLADLCLQAREDHQVRQSVRSIASEHHTAAFAGRCRTPAAVATEAYILVVRAAWTTCAIGRDELVRAFRTIDKPAVAALAGRLRVERGTPGTAEDVIAIVDCAAELAGTLDGGGHQIAETLCEDSPDLRAHQVADAAGALTR